MPTDKEKNLDLALIENVKKILETQIIKQKWPAAMLASVAEAVMEQVRLGRPTEKGSNDGMLVLRRILQACKANGVDPTSISRDQIQLVVELYLNLIEARASLLALSEPSAPGHQIVSMGFGGPMFASVASFEGNDFSSGTIQSLPELLSSHAIWAGEYGALLDESIDQVQAQLAQQFSSIFPEFQDGELEEVLALLCSVFEGVVDFQELYEDFLEFIREIDPEDRIVGMDLHRRTARLWSTVWELRQQQTRSLIQATNAVFDKRLQQEIAPDDQEGREIIELQREHNERFCRTEDSNLASLFFDEMNRLQKLLEMHLANKSPKEDNKSPKAGPDRSDLH